MTKPKPIVDKGLILYYDYEFIFNFLSNEELGILIRQLLSDKDKPKLNPTENSSVNNAYNYIANRILDYKNKKIKASEDGKKGGNPLLTLKGTDNPTDNGGVKLKEKKRNIKEIKRKENKLKEKEETDYTFYVNEWNKNFPDSRLLNLKPDRKKKLKTRISNDSDFNKHFLICLNKIKESDFLSGNSNNWKASFDWLIANDSNYIKVLENQYKNKENKKKKTLEEILDEWE